MKYTHIKRFLLTALLLTFTTTSGMTYAYSTTASSLSDSMVLSGDVKLTNSNNRITLSLRDSDVKQVLRMFADKAGMNVVFHDSVSGKITLDLVNMPINDAFKLVLQISGLNYYTQNNTLIIVAKSSADNAAFSKQEMMVFPVKYVSAGKIASFLNKNVFGMKKAGMSGVDAATVNSATNEIIVFGMKSDAAIVEKVIAQLDREPISKTFAVNHTTPAEMANLICDVLLPSRGATKNENNGGGEDIVIPATPGVGTSTGGAAGIVTGGAASSSSDSELKLGEGVVACSVSSNAGSGAAGFDIQNLSVAYFPQRGTVTVTGGSLDQQSMIEKFIKDNDIKQPQAYLEVSIIELNEDGSKTFHNDWTLTTGNWGFSFTGSSDNGTQGGSENGRSGLNNTKLSWAFQYIIKTGKGRVLANPKVLITNGQESVIDLTQDYVEKVTSEFMSSTSSGYGSSGVAQKTYSIGKDQGIKVSLTPFISPEGYVTLNIKPEYATIADRITTPVYDEETGKSSDEIQATLLSRRNLDLKNVRIKDNETLAIGGLIQETETKTIKKIPVLGDLPVVGTAFRSTVSEKQKSELVIMITPKIINDGEEGTLSDSL